MMAATSIDPLEHLPYEICANILQCLSSDAPEGPLPYIGVSQRWSRAILEEPNLWTSVIIDESADEDARIRTFLYLSRDHLLDVTVIAPFARLDGLRAVLEEAHRIRSFRISTGLPGPRSYNIFAQGVLQFLQQSVSIYPQMKTMDIEAHIFNAWDDLVKKSPDIRIIRGIHLRVNTILYSQIQEARANPGSWDDALKLVLSDSLTSLSIDTGFFKTENLVVQADQLMNRVSWKLNRLDISLGWSQVLMLSPLLFALQTLRTLTLQLGDYGDLANEWVAPVLAFDEMQRLEDLAIRITFPRRASDHHKESVMKMFTANQPFKHLKTLSIQADFYIESMSLYSLLHSVSGIRRLSLDVMVDTNKFDKPPVIMKNLLHLSLSPAIIINYLEAPIAINTELFAPERRYFPNAPLLGTSVSNLRVDTRVFDHINRGWPAHHVATQWASLQCIQFQRLEWCSTTVTQVSSLRIIDFYSLSRAYLRGSALPAIDGLLRDLLLNRDACPHLHTIKSPHYPAWEPLFEVLRRRNSSEISSLKVITLPGYPVLSILSPLVLLLQGRVDVHTPVDIDDLIYRRFTDPDEKLCVNHVPVFAEIAEVTVSSIACLQCAISGYTHCKLKEGTEVMPEEDTKPGDLSLMNLYRDDPVSGQPLLERLIKMRDPLGLPNPRLRNDQDALACFRHLHAVDVTGSTLDGKCKTLHAIHSTEPRYQECTTRMRMIEKVSLDIY